MRPFHIMVKPIGPICNLRCEYCFYLHKSGLYPNGENFKMNDEVLEHFVSEYIKNQPGPEVPFAWQGGEPTLMGLDFFRKVVAFQKKYIPDGWRFTNAIQTNATLITPEWAKFLKEEEFLVGVSLDGPEDLHNLYRRDKNGQGTYELVIQGLKNLQNNAVEVNILCVVNQANAQYPRRVYQSFKDLGCDYIQFIPLVEVQSDGTVGARSVSGEQYGSFLIEIFNDWLHSDIGEVFVQTFEEAVTIAAGFPASLCVYREECGQQLIMEHNGDIYSCDHFVTPKYKLGNIMEKPVEEMVSSASQLRFGQEKSNLSAHCMGCLVLHYCQGACPKDRMGGEGENKTNWLCTGYRQFFGYADPFVHEIVNTLQQRKTASQASNRLEELFKSTWDVSRNEPCPCQSGRKYKKCCGR